MKAAAPVEQSAESASKTQVGAQVNPKLNSGAQIRDAEEKEGTDDNEEKLDQKEQEQQQDILRKTGARLWPELTEEQQQSALKKEKEFLQKVGQAIPAGALRLKETNYFLFYSDLPPAYVQEYVSHLDGMYAKLCKLFEIQPGTNIWRGKAIVVAFADKQNYVWFEHTYCNHESTGEQGRANYKPNGRVVISLYAGKDPKYFKTLIIHETVHGFLYRYKSGKKIPSWLGEGCADWIAAYVVRTNDSVQRKQQKAIQKVGASKTLGGNFFAGNPIEFWQYGIASSMVDFMLRRDPKCFRELIEGIKQGKTWQESLQETYKLTPEQLVKEYGNHIGVPDLQL